MERRIRMQGRFGLSALPPSRTSRISDGSQPDVCRCLASTTTSTAERRQHHTGER